MIPADRFICKVSSVDESVHAKATDGLEPSINTADDSKYILIWIKPNIAVFITVCDDSFKNSKKSRQKYLCWNLKKLLSVSAVPVYLTTG